MAEVLNFSTTDFERPTVIIDETAYELRSPEEFGTDMAMAQRRLKNRRDEFGSTEKNADGEDVFVVRDNLTDEEFEAFHNLGRDSLDIYMVDLPDEVRNAIPVVFVRKIITIWTGLFMEAVGDAKPASPTP